MSNPIGTTSRTQEAATEPRAPKLLQRMSDILKRLHYSPRTSDAYLGWVRRYIVFHCLRHPNELKQADIEAFLTHLAVRRKVSASTQNQALSAILFLYRKVLCEDAPWIEAPERAYRPKRMPVVLTSSEVARVLSLMQGTPGLIGRLLYGSGLRLTEALTLRVKDIDFVRNDINRRIDLGKYAPAA